MAISEKDFKQELINIQYEGYLQKQSRVLKTWRKRWFVVTLNYIFTFKQQNQYSSPTQVIALEEIMIIKKSDEQTHREFSFKIQTHQQAFFMVASSNSDREKWLGSIGSALLKCKKNKEKYEEK